LKIAHQIRHQSLQSSSIETSLKAHVASGDRHMTVIVNVVVVVVVVVVMILGMVIKAQQNFAVH